MAGAQSEHPFKSPEFTGHALGGFGSSSLHQNLAMGCLYDGGERETGQRCRWSEGKANEL